jgi:hypothetical protein
MHIDLVQAIGRVEGAVRQLEKEGFVIDKLKQNLGLLQAIQK